MGKRLTLITFLIFTTTLFCIGRAHKFRLPHKLKTDNTCLQADSSVSANDILHFAQSLIGIRYRSRSSNPLLGFDCSGFVSYVFKKFNFNVPRSSYDFISIGKKVKLEDALPGDIILFTGTKSYIRKIGHVGIVYSKANGEFKFIHSTSGKEHGVTITDMDEHYRRRFVQVIRLLI